MIYKVKYTCLICSEASISDLTIVVEDNLTQFEECFYISEMKLNVKKPNFCISNKYIKITNISTIHVVVDVNSTSVFSCRYFSIEIGDELLLKIRIETDSISYFCFQGGQNLLKGAYIQFPVSASRKQSRKIIIFSVARLNVRKQVGFYV